MDKASQTVLAIIILTAIALVVLGLRWVSRLAIIRRFWLEDYLISAAFVLSCGFTAIIILLPKAFTDEAAAMKTQYKFLYASIIIYNLTLILIKLSLLFQCLRFFTERRYRYTAFALIFLVTMGGIAFTIPSILSCRPIYVYWSDPRESTRCIHIVAFRYAFSGFHIATDVLVWILPMPLLTTLNLPRKQKISLIGVFMLGGLYAITCEDLWDVSKSLTDHSACIVAGLRVDALRASYRVRNSALGHLKVMMWSSVEMNIGIICACLPTIRPMIALMFPGAKFSARDPYSGQIRTHTIPVAHDRDDSSAELADFYHGACSSQHNITAENHHHL